MGRKRSKSVGKSAAAESNGSSRPPIPQKKPKPSTAACAGTAEPSLHRQRFRPNCKRLGEASEAEFIARAQGLDFPVAKLWGESDPYDNLVGFGRTFWRVQVKCARAEQHGQYVVKGCSNRRKYTRENIDFLAAHIVPENIWYIIPVEAFEGKTMLKLSPHGAGRAKYEKYREAWCLLTCKPKARGWKDIPVKCRCRELPARCAVCPNRDNSPDAKSTWERTR